jgi:hypothetical protein
MDTPPALTGWIWIKQGFVLFRKQPAELSTLFLSYMFLMLAVGIVPLLGQILPLMLVPVFSITFMQACINVESGKRVYPNLLLTGFRSPALKRLLTLGVLYLLAAIVAMGISSLVDGGVFWQMMTGRAAIDARTMRASNMLLAMLVAALVYIPAAMAFWYAAPLTAWQGMSLPKAIFYSFFAVRRAGKAFLVYLFGWLIIGVILPLLVSSLLALLTGKAFVTVLVLLPLSIILTVIMYCSFYPTYTSIFGKLVPAAPRSGKDPAPP